MVTMAVGITGRWYLRGMGMSSVAWYRFSQFAAGLTTFVIPAGTSHSGPLRPSTGRAILCPFVEVAVRKADPCQSMKPVRVRTHPKVPFSLPSGLHRGHIARLRAVA
jgi:hypothetical protein